MRLQALGFSPPDASTLADHFLDADRRGKPSHGTARIEWLEGFDALDPHARPARVRASEAFELWDGNGALGYLTLAAICDGVVSAPPAAVRVVAAARCFPTGMLGYWVRRLAVGGLVSMLTATSPARLAHPDGGEPLVGTNPLAIGLPDPGGPPIVVDVSMGKVTHGDVLRGVRRPRISCRSAATRRTRRSRSRSASRGGSSPSSARSTARCSSSHGPGTKASPRECAAWPSACGFPATRSAAPAVERLAQSWCR